MPRPGIPPNLNYYIQEVIMWKWINRLNRIVRFLSILSKIIVALLDSLDPDNNPHFPELKKYKPPEKKA